MGVVEREEAIKRQLGTEVVVLTREHLLSHTSADLCGEVEDGAEAKITTFTALVIFAVLDSSSSEQGVHASVNIFVEMETLLCFGNTATSSHKDTV